MSDNSDVERPIVDLQEKLETLKKNAENNASPEQQKLIKEVEAKIVDLKNQIYANLTPWQKVLLSRHPCRPYTLAYIESIFTNFIELHGDRAFADDHAIVGGFCQIEGQTVMVIGHQKGVNTKMRQYRNFGMANPQGYRKALRLMKLAEKFNKPVITFVDTPGAYPGIEAEKNGQAEAIARNLFEMARLKTPIITFVIGEGASGGALGLAVSDRVYMLENTWYSVISPESCSAILWRNRDHKEQAAESLKLTAKDLKKGGIIDGIIAEPLGGAHENPEEAANSVKKQILKDLKILTKLEKPDLVAQRIGKYEKMATL